MNYATFIVKILEKPEQSFFNDNTSVTEVLVKFSQVKNNASKTVFQLSFWGNLAYDIAQYYRVNDYIIIEGYISLRESLAHQSTFSVDKQVEISVFKVYPFIINSIEVGQV